MMEVKQNSAVDLNDLLTSSKSSGADEVDDAVMADLTDRHHDLVKCETMKANDKTSSVHDISNGNMDMSSLINDVEIDTDVSTPVNPELEDALLAGDDVLPKLDNKHIEQTSAVADDYILADKVETSNSTTSSSNLRDPGDDLDTLLSKINDIVEDCIENEADNNDTEKILESASAQMETNSVEDKDLNDSTVLEEEVEAISQDDIIKETDKETDAVIASNEIENISCSKPASEILDSSKKKDEQKVLEKTSNEKASILNTNSEKENSPAPLASVEDSLKISKNPEEKTEYSNLEAVQDNEISSNSNETMGDSKKETTLEDIENDVSLKSPVNTALDKEVSEVSNDDGLHDDVKNKTTENNEITAVEDTKLNEQNENEDSDDEIVFYVDKPPETKENNVQKEEEPTETVQQKEPFNEKEKEKDEIKKQPEESNVKKISQDDDDVVLLLDDDEDEGNQSIKKEQSVKEDSLKSHEESKNTENDKPEELESKAETAKEIEMDNSDNARDDFVCEKANEEEKVAEKTELTETAEEANSNCSSSSNLLQEAKSVENTVDEPSPEEGENDEEDDEGEVELIESELKETDSTTKIDDSDLAPPAKRLRLSQDSVESSKPVEDSQDTKESSIVAEDKKLTEDLEVSKVSDTLSSTLKRSHDVIEVETDEKSNDSKASNEGPHKKLRTDDLQTEIKPAKTVEDEKPSEDIKSADDFKTDIKAVPSYQPIPLYPPPKFETIKTESSLKLDFLKRFRKSFDNMTKQDLEELVLQKVVEAIIHRSEFSEMRELIEKQEKLITAHRAKISELSKQFRDLEMVHNRVVKDIEQRNSQFIMPVKITRAVGLQVYIPNKKSMPDTASSSSVSNVPSSPQRSLANHVTSASSSSLNPPQRQIMTSQTETQQQRAGSSIANAATNASGIRRGCAQKITPTRPVPGTNQTPSAGSTVYRNSSNQTVSSQPRILNKNAAQPANAASVQRSRFLGPNQDGQRLQTPQQISRSPNMVASGQRAGPITPAQPKAPSNTNASTQRSSSTSSTSSIVDNYINTLTHLTGGNTAVSITPAKPKEKAVIDLTDEDETPNQTSSAQPATQLPVQRRSLPGQNNTSSQLQYGRSAPPLARIAPANQIANKNRQMPSIQAQKNSNSFTSISTPAGTSITRINVSSNASNVQRVKYSHPAPLPATPPQAFNPAWKLPPPRPTIRISNLDNGIVISWTMEESMDRHAECVSYQIYAYQETSGPPMVDSWRHVGDVKAMLLPMAVTLTQFQEGQRYFFAVRAVDCHQRFGPFSLPKTWS